MPFVVDVRRLDVEEVVREKMKKEEDGIYSSKDHEITLLPDT